MPPKTPGTSYTSKPVRKLRLPKTGPAKTKSLFEEYFYTLLAVIFFAAAILGKAGGFSGFNALVIAAWVTAFLWFASQLKGYLGEKSKAANGKMAAPQVEARVEAPKKPVPLPPGMKPMIGPQWPVKPGARPIRLPRQARPQLKPATPASAPQAPTLPAPPGQPSTTPPDSEKRFVYERPTLPDRKARLPNNWPKPEKKKPQP